MLIQSELVQLLVIIWQRNKANVLINAALGVISFLDQLTPIDLGCLDVVAKLFTMKLIEDVSNIAFIKEVTLRSIKVEYSEFAVLDGINPLESIPFLIPFKLLSHIILGVELETEFIVLRNVNGWPLSAIVYHNVLLLFGLVHQERERMIVCESNSP